MYGCVGNPVCCPPQYCVRDYYTQRIVPVIHPIVNINRQNIIDVPQHYYQPITRNVVVDRGFQSNFGYAGYANRLFF
ncbi:MAG: spore coat protein D [Desulfitobacteriaceae bacterium]